MSVQDLEGLEDISISSYDHPSKVLVQDVPVHKRDCTVLKYYLTSLIAVDCEVKQYQGGKSFLATFHRPIDFQLLKEKGRKIPYDDTYQLTFCHMLDSKNRRILVTFCSQDEKLMNEYVVKLHFEAIAGRGSIEKIDFLPPDQVCVMFKDAQSVKKVVANPDSQVLADTSACVEEYYDFMIEETDSQQPPLPQVAPPPAPEPTFDWHPTQHPVDELQAAWLWRNLQKLKNEFSTVNALAKLSNQPGSSSSSSLVEILPLSGAEKMSDWEDQVKNILETFLSCFKTHLQPIPQYCREEILQYAESQDCPSLTVRMDNDVLTLAGDGRAVDEVSVTVDDMIRNFVQVEERDFPLKHIKYLKRFCMSKLINLPVEHGLDCDLRAIQIKGNEESRKMFWDMVAAEIAKIHEKSFGLTPEGFKLLSSQRGSVKIQEIIGAHQIGYVMEDLKICLFSPQKDAPLKDVKESLKMCTYSHEAVQDPTKFRFCSDIKWKQLVDKLQGDVFALVTVNDATRSVTVTGEKVVVDSVVQRIALFLSEQTCVQEQVKIPSQKWIVISKSFDTEISNIKHSVQGKDVKITWPSRGERLDATVVIKGEPAEVDRVKGEIEALRNKVCEKEVKLCNIPAAIQVVDSMEDKIRLIENNFGAAIDVSLMSDDTNPPTSSAQSTCTPVCTAMCPNDVRVSVYTGNFTKHNHVDAIVNFVPPDPTFQEDNLKQLFAAGGIRDDFKSKMGQFLKHTPGDIFSSNQGKLLCGQLLHCFVLPWIDGQSSEIFYLDMALSKVPSKLRNCDRILLTSLCSSPLKYPPVDFASSVISLITSNLDIASFGQLTVAVYVDTLAQAREFEKQFQLNNCRIAAPVPSHQPVSTTPTTTTTTTTTTTSAGPISSFLTLTQGSLLQQQAEVYINSTNRNMELSTGTLSKELLKACGDELQKKCNDHTPLEEEDVFITEAKNLKANSIYHVALPDYNSDHQAKKKFRKTIQVILRTARDNTVKSLAFPSLGVGNLHYPAHLSANILFEEIIAFQAKNRSSNTKYYCVVYDQSTYKEFSKEYAKRMNTAPPPKKVLTGGKKGSGSTLLSVVKSDIAEEPTDVIVNTTTAEMKLNDSAVSKALLRKAGPSLQQACDLLVLSGLKLDHGQITDTKSFGSLKCKRIIHAHLPPRSEATRSGVNHYSLIIEIVTKCLEKAEGMNMKSVSFPAFGFGQGGYSVDQVAEPMLTAFRDFGRQSPKSIEIIRVVIFDSGLHQKFFDFFVNFFKVDVSTPLKIVSSIYKTLNPSSGQGERSVELQDGKSSVATRPFGHGYQEPLASQLLVFKIFAGTSGLCDQIAAKLREHIKEKYETDTIEKPVIANLIDADIEELMSIGVRHQVEVKVLTQIKKLSIQGETNHVRDAKLEIIQVINDIEKAGNELKLFQWQSENSSSEIDMYSEEDSFKLERAKAKGLAIIEMTIDGISVVIDLNRMEERNKSTGDVRKVTRVPIKPSLELPKTWQPQPVDTDNKEIPMEMFEVAQGSAEYQDALKRFNDTIGQTVTIVSLKRIQNPVEYHRYVAVRDSIAKKYSKKPDVRQLFHGSVEDSVKAIAVQGFNRNYAGKNAAYYGQGVYFAVNASYSAQAKYSTPNKQGHQFMFLCQVIIGKYTLGKKGMKVAAQENLETYDTLVENTSNPTIFVAMTDGQAYPEYLVTFKVEKSKN